MSEQRPGEQETPASSVEIPRDEWSDWCTRMTEADGGRTMSLRFTDEALGEVDLSDDQSFIGLDYEQLGSAIALTIHYGHYVLAMHHVIAEPRQILQESDASGRTVLVEIVDSTRRRTFISLS